MNFVGNCTFASNIAGVLIGSCKFCLFNCCDTEEGMLFPGLPRFCSSVCVQYDTQKRKSNHSSTPVYYTERKPKNKKMGEGWGRGYVCMPPQSWGNCKYPNWSSVFVCFVSVLVCT